VGRSNGTFGGDIRCIVSAKTQYSASVLKLAIFILRLLFAFLRDQRGVKEEAISSSGPSIGGISCPISIKVGLQNKRLNGKGHNVEKGALKISKNKTVS
jgi:hypothetical protein